MDIFLIRALQVIMSLSLLVLIHETGHFLFARLFKVRVEKFCLFFDPWFTLFKFKPKRSETEYAMGWLPLGGYVKISGMIDESMDLEQMKQPPQPWEFRTKPAWQRLFIMIGGVLFNLLLALFIYSMILFTWGDEYIKVAETPYGMDYNATAHAVGFQDGDILLEADGVPFKRYDGNMLSHIVESKAVTVLRDGCRVDIAIPSDMMQGLMADSVRFASFRFPYVVAQVAEQSPAAAAGIMPGDSVVALNGKQVASFSDFKKLVAELERRADQGVDTRTWEVAYVRAGVLDTAVVRVDSTFLMGVVPQTDMGKWIPVEKVTYTLAESFPAGIKLGWDTLEGYVKNLKHVFSKEGAKQLGGFGTIGSLFPTVWDWHQFWYMTAFLSIMLAFMNILPIPALDGGHVLFLLYEIVTRRKPSEKFLERAQMVGMFLLLGLLLWANFNDILRFVF